MATRAIPVRIEWTDEQKAALAPLFAKLEELNRSAEVGQVTVFGQASSDSVFLFLTPGAASRGIRGVLDSYKSSIAAIQPETSPVVRVRYEAEMTRAATFVEGENIVAWYEDGAA